MILQSDVPESGVEKSQGLVSKVEGVVKQLQTRPGRHAGWLKQPHSYLRVMHFCLVVPTPVRKVHEYDQRVYKYDEMSYETTSGHSWVSFHINIRSLLRYPSITFARH